MTPRIESEAPGSSWGAGFALRCDAAGVVQEMLLQDGEPFNSVLVGRSLLDSVDPDSRLKLEGFLAAAHGPDPAVGWEINMPCPGGLRTFVFAAVSLGGGMIVAASPGVVGLARLIDEIMMAQLGAEPQAALRLGQAVHEMLARAEADRGLFDELARLNNEFAVLQRELAKRNRELVEQRIWLWSILSAIDDAVIAVDHEGTVTFMNSAAKRLTGRESGAEGARSIEDLVRLQPEEPIADTPPELSDAWRSGIARSVDRAVIVRPNGDRIPVSCAATPLGGGTGQGGGGAEPGGAVILLRDMTSARRLQKLVIESEKMETAQLIVAGTAHTVNNILMAILTNAGLLARNLSPPQMKTVENIRDSVRRASDLTTRMLSFSDNRLATSEIVDLNAVVRTAVEGPVVGSPGRSIAQKLAAAGAPVKGDPVQLGVVVANILLNAIEATDEKGTIEIATSVEQATVRLTVADTGVGMDDTVLRRLFAPFFSTKFLGRGLGLASARSIIRAHGGEISVESAEGKGTTVTVSLPSAIPGDTCGPS